MKILNLSLDSSILDKDSRSARRVVEYGNLVEKYVIIAPAKKDERVVLSDKMWACGVSGVNRFFRLIRIYKLASKIIQEEKMDVISVQDQYFLAFLGWFLAKKHQVGLELQVHGFEKYRGLRKYFSKFVIPRTDSLRVVNQRLKQRMIEEFEISQDKITVVPIYVEVKSQKSERLKVKSNNENNFVFLTVGRLVSVKNIGLQIEAIAEIIKTYPEAELWIVGDGPEAKKLKVKSSKLKVEKNIKFFGWQGSLTEYYSRADAFLLTSNSEGWGLAVIEAASFSLSIIMTDVGSAGELIKDRESGIVIEVGNLTMLEQAMIELIADSNLRQRLGQAAKAAVMKLPTKEEIFELYQESWRKAKK